MDTHPFRTSKQVRRGRSLLCLGSQGTLSLPHLFPGPVQLLTTRALS